MNCCRQSPTVLKGCISELYHDYSHIVKSELAERWKLHATPKFAGLGRPRVAVALDCEMGRNIDDEQELIRLTMIDFFTKETLIDSLVSPTQQLKSTSRKYSGISFSMLKNAELSGNIIDGRDSARALMWNFIDPSTVIIAHGGVNDMAALRWIHLRVVDTLLLEALQDQVSEKRSLKHLTLGRCGRAIQGGHGHDSLEDALATRELVIAYSKIPRKYSSSYELTDDEIAALTVRIMPNISQPPVFSGDQSLELSCSS